MTLKEKVNADLITAMKAHDENRVRTLRLLKAAILKFEVSGTEKADAKDETVLQIIGKEVKQRKDSIEAYKNAGRVDLAASEEVEYKILHEYLPAQMSEEEVKAVVARVIEKTGMSKKADFGKVMSAVMAEVKGKTDGQTVSKVVGGLLK